ncbi:hypothetical protein AHAS_Ahas15G0282100 [Arachis hypogaea]
MLNIEVNIVIVPYTFLAVHVDSLNQAGQYDLVAIKELDQGPAASTMNSVLSLDDGRWWHPAVESCSPVPLPPLVLAQVYPESSPIPPSKVADPRPGPAKSSQDSGPGPTCENDGRFFETGFQKHTKKLRDMWCSCRLPENMVFHITTLIIPKQESTSDSCSTLNEEEIFEVQDILSLFPLGWIHGQRRTLVINSGAISILRFINGRPRGRSEIFRNCKNVEKGFVSKSRTKVTKWKLKVVAMLRFIGWVGSVYLLLQNFSKGLDEMLEEMWCLTVMMKEPFSWVVRMKKVLTSSAMMLTSWAVVLFGLKSWG